MDTRDQYPDPQGHKGVQTVTFNTIAESLGKTNHLNFESQWQKIHDRVYDGKLPSSFRTQILTRDTHRRRHMCYERMESVQEASF